MSAWSEAAEALAGVLAEENAALGSLDFQTAVGLLGQKRAAVARLETAAPAMEAQPARALLGRLHGLAMENRRLLERALRVQSRVIAIVAGALPIPPPASYGRNGATTSARATSVALSARA